MTGVMVESFVVGAFQENSYLVIDEATHRAVLIDPGGEGERIDAALRAHGAELEAIWLTHAHVDHVAGVAAMKRLRDVPVHLHPLDRPLYDNAAQHGARLGIVVEPPPVPDHELADGDVLRVGSLAFDVMHAPGHAPGHVVIHGHGVAFVGDCLFAGSVGRTDLPLSNGAHLARSLEIIAALPAATVVYAGHGPATTIGRERASNPFLNGVARVPGAGRG
ncbi:MAG: MBL fold metallo-hydrolase [Gemmatimonadaceae bacterium]